MKLSTIKFLATFAFLMGCVSADKDLDFKWDPEGFQPVVYESMSELDKRDISLLQTSNTVMQGYEGISGRLLKVLALVVDNMQQTFSDRCGQNPQTNHLFFYEERDNYVSIIATRRFTPDAENQLRETYIGDGQKQLTIPLSPGATILPGCVIEYSYDETNNELNFVQFHR